MAPQDNILNSVCILYLDTQIFPQPLPAREDILSKSKHPSFQISYNMFRLVQAIDGIDNPNKPG
jgi:hypothetical protein